MGRVETRMYRQKRQRAKTLRRGILLVVAAVVMLVIWRKNPGLLEIERIGLPTEAPRSKAEARMTETREVTLAEEIWYAIQTGVFSTEEAARQKADEYVQRGAPGTVINEGEKWRVFIACYATETEASAVRSRLQQYQKVDTYLYAWTCPELRLRLTGQAGQLDAVEAGFTLLSSTATALRDTAKELDAAQLTTSEVTAVMDKLDHQITLWEETIRSAFGRQEPQLMADLLSISGNWDNRYAVIKKAESATEISAALKDQAMGMFDEIAAWRRDFAAR